VAEGYVTDTAQVNQLIQSMGVKFRAEMIRPVGLTPKWFPVPQSFTFAATHNFLSLPRAVRQMLTYTTPEERAQQGKRLGAAVSPLAIWLIGYHFLVGREILIDQGQLRPQARVEQIARVLDCWRRLSFTHRGDGHVDNSEAGATNLFLPSTIVRQLYQALIPMDTSIRRRVTEFVSTLEGYLFLLNAEARLGIVDSGPYPLNIERVLIVRDFFDLTGMQYPWHKVAAHLPYHSCSLAFTLDPSEFHSIELSDRSLLLTTPLHYVEAIREIALVSSDGNTLQVLPFTEMDWLVRMVKRVQPKLLEWFGKLSQREWITYGALPWIVPPFSLVARPEDSVEEFAPEAAQLLPTYEDDDTRAVRWATHCCLAPGKSSAFVPLL
jgi:hypothetical protein